MPTGAIRSQGKSRFVKEILNGDPFANAAAVNQAWRAVGMLGNISAGLVNHLRSRMGLSGNLRGGRPGRTETGTRRSGPPMQVRTGANGSTPARPRGKRRDLRDLEVAIDRLLMPVTETGALPEVEDALRKARRNLYVALAVRS